MKPVTPIIPGIELPEIVFAKDQPEYIPLPAFRDDGGAVLTRWSLTWGERIRVFLSGNLWLTVLTFGRPLQPLKLEAIPPNIAVQRGAAKGEV